MNPKTSNYLQVLSRKARSNEQFLGSALAVIAAENGLEMAEITSKLKCPKENITILSLCKLPRESAQFFYADVRSISEYSGCDASELANMVREYRAINAMRQFNQSQTSYDSMLMAARDKKDDMKVPDKLDDETDES